MKKFLELDVDGGDRSGIACFPYYIMLCVAYVDKRFDRRERREISNIIFNDEHLRYKSMLMLEIVKDNYRGSIVPKSVTSALMKKSKFENISYIKHIADVLMGSLSENEYNEFCEDILMMAFRVANASKTSILDKTNISNDEEAYIKEIYEILNIKESYMEIKAANM